METEICCICKKEKNTNEQWWYLNNYFGLFGLFCNTCYAKVSHNGFDKPKHPKLYKQIKEQLNEN